MADPTEFDDVLPENTARRKPEEPMRESLISRLIHMIVIAVMMSFVGTIVGVLAVFQFVIMLFNGRAPNPRLADLGTDVGIWFAKAARYQTAASEDKPWPWSDLD